MKQGDSSGGIIAACLAISTIITAQTVVRLNLPFTCFGVLTSLFLFAASTLGVFVVGVLTSTMYRILVEEAHASLGSKLLFWCVYIGMLLIITLILISVL